MVRYFYAGAGGSVRIASAFGGLIYITLPAGTALGKTLQIHVSGGSWDWPQQRRRGAFPLVLCLQAANASPETGLMAAPASHAHCILRGLHA